MPDDLEQLLAGSADARPLPDALRERVERTLTDRPWARDVPPELEGIDAARSLPRGARSGLEHRLAALAKDALADLDAERTLPATVRARLERTLAPEPMRRRAMVVRAMAVAASVMLIASGLGAVTRDRGPRVLTTIDGSEVTPGGVAAGPGAPTNVGTLPDSVVVDLPSPIERPIVGGGAVSPSNPDAPPPFAFGDAYGSAQPDQAHAMPGGSAALPDPPSPPPPPLRIGIFAGDASIEAGFRAYVHEVNAAGGVRGHALALTAVTPSQPSPSTIATVNLSRAPIASAGGAPSWTHGPLLETFSATEPVLSGDVFGFASAPERQAHLIASHLFPAGARGATAVVYTAGSSLFTATIPEAIETVLRARGVTPIRVAFDRSSDATVFFPADAAFLSMDRADASAWIDVARARGFAPSRGVGALYPMFDQAWRPPASLGIRVLSPYSLAGLQETSALREAAGTMTAATIHGWVTAKMLAMAIYNGYATNASTLRTSLRGLRAYGNGFAPPYEVRNGTTSRTPEGLVYRFTDDRVVAETGFLRDRF